MTEDNYSKRELDHLIVDIKNQLDRIEQQTIKHNGRLTKVERWNWTMVGAVTILGFLVANKLLVANSIL